MLCKEVESDQEVVLTTVSDEHKGIRVHYSIKIKVQGYPMGNFFTGSAGVVSDGYSIMETCGFCSVIFNGFKGFLHIIKDMSIYSGVS